MDFVIGLLTVVLVVDALFLILLVLVQLPKKDAGVGSAFGGGATDALFGPGSGSVLTKATKWATIIFLGLALTLSFLGVQAKRTKSSKSDELQKKSAPATTPQKPIFPGILPPPTNTPASSTNKTAVVPATNSLSPATNAPVAPKK
ncbi:MAG: preprotein translocase subunit SecG [Pedosphaera sp.]|nr:preprotein translocase subunit SecG [Pedosphaera sp.]MSS99893.1 preprotein translocase subunit SecG [Pedosphaera sp.]